MTPAQEPCYYNTYTHNVCIPLHLLNGAEYKRLLTQCYGSTSTDQKYCLIPAMFWQEGYEFLKHKHKDHPALEGFNQLLAIGACEPGEYWETTRPWLKDYCMPVEGQLRDYQSQAVSAILDNPNMLLGDDMGLGKALWNEERVLMAGGGTKKISEIQFGEWVQGPDNRPIQVVGVYPQGLKDAYCVEFEDGTTTICCDEHLWTIELPHFGVTQTNTTKQLEQMLWSGKQHILPAHRAPEWQSKQLNIDPYLLGVYLGDGSGCNVITTGDEEMITSLLPAVLPEGMWIEHVSKYDYVLKHNLSPTPFTKQLRWLGLEGKRAWEKFVPRDYLFSSIIDRHALLQGLLDTDATNKPNSSTVYYCSTSLQLINDVCFLVRSLGGLAKIQPRKKDKNRQCWNVRINLPNDYLPYRLPRRLATYKINLEVKRKEITRIYPLGVQYPMTCIKVNTAQGLFMTDKWTVTHNTVSTLVARHELMRERNIGWRTLIIVPTLEVANSWQQNLWRFYRQLCVHIDDRKHFRDEKKLRFLKGIGIWVIMYSKIRIQDYYEHIINNIAPEYTYLVADEVHNCGRDATKQSQFLLKLKQHCAWFTGLTGTEFGGRIEDYRTVYELSTGVNHDQSDWNNYLSRGLTDYNTGKPKWSEDRLKSINAIRGTYCLRREKHAVANLPPVTGPLPILIPMTYQHRQAYKELWNTNKYEFINELNELQDVTVEHFFAKYVRMYQMSTLPKLLGIPMIPEFKLDALINLLEEAGSQQAIIWCNFPECIEWLAFEINKRMPGKRCGYAHGGVSQNERNAIVHQFQELRTMDYVVANPQIWGEGVTLTAASIVIYWNLHPSRYKWKQSQDRPNRIGQTLPITIYCLIHEDSVEALTYNYLGKKDYWNDLIVHGGAEKKGKLKGHHVKFALKE